MYPIHSLNHWFWTHYFREGQKIKNGSLTMKIMMVGCFYSGHAAGIVALATVSPGFFGPNMESSVMPAKSNRLCHAGFEEVPNSTRPISSHNRHCLLVGALYEFQAGLTRPLTVLNFPHAEISPGRLHCFSPAHFFPLQRFSLQRFLN